MNYKGACHCGKIAFEVKGSIEQVVDCNCSICSKRGYLLWFAPREQLNLKTPGENLSTYTFNTGNIKHHFCSSCGCAPFGVGKDKSGTAMAAINVRCLENFDITSLKIMAVDGRSM